MPHQDKINEYVEEVNKVVNNFITNWCGKNSSHLLDSDENDGETLRTFLRTSLASYGSFIAGEVRDACAEQSIKDMKTVMKKFEQETKEELKRTIEELETQKFLDKRCEVADFVKIDSVVAFLEKDNSKE